MEPNVFWARQMYWNKQYGTVCKIGITLIKIQLHDASKKSSGSKLESTMYEFNKQMINCFIIEDVLIQICLLTL